MVDDPAPPPGKEPPRAALLLISAAAVLVAIAHTIFPDVKIDGITLALMAVAALPWLAPLLTSVELPGGFKFQLREVQRELHKKAQQVEQLASRVDQVERFVQFAGTPNASLQDRLDTKLREFHEYLEGNGVELLRPPPRVELGPTEANRGAYSEMNAHYDGERQCIVLGERIADDPDVVLRQYCHHVLREMAPALARPWADGDPVVAVWSGLADYFPCSFKGSPEFAPLAGATILKRPYVRNLKNGRSFAVPSANDGESHSAGEVWGGLFWDVRSVVGQTAADRAIIASWKDLGAVEEPSDATAVATTLLASLEHSLHDGREALRPMFARRGALRA